MKTPVVRNFYDKLTSLDSILSLSSGVLLVLSFPKSDLSRFAFVSLIPLLYALNRPTKNISGMTCGIITGFVFYLGTIYWITLTMENYGGVPRALSLLILALLSAYLALFIGIFSWGSSRMAGRPVLFITGVPFLWVALEYARGHLFTGFPWAFLGYTQYRNLLMIQIADVTGIYGVSFFIVLVNAALAQLFFTHKNFKPLGKRIIPFIVVALSLALVFSYGAYRLHRIQVLGGNPDIKVGVVQGNIDQDQKWDPKFRDMIMSIHTRLTREAAKEEPDLIIWPEASVPFYFMAEKHYQSELLSLIDEMGIDLLFGSPDYTVVNGESFFYNSAFLVSPGAKLKGRYNKIHLVPFGEYVPLRKMLFFVRPIIDQIGDITPGRGISLMKTRKGDCGTPICFEIIFPDLVRRFVLHGAKFITTMTNDDWFGQSSAPYQHFSMAVFRAVENRVPVVRAANSGVSGVIAADGRIIRKTHIFEEDVFTETISFSQTGPTFYTRFGDLFAFFCLGGSVVAMVLTRKKG